MTESKRAGTSEKTMINYAGRKDGVRAAERSRRMRIRTVSVLCRVLTPDWKSS